MNSRILVPATAVAETRTVKPTTLFLFFSTLTVASQAVEPDRIPTDRPLTIRLYDYTGITPGTLERAREEAGRVLARAGVRVRWEQCRTSEGETHQDASCTQRAGAHVIQLRIHPKEMAKKLTKRGIEFGYSIPLETGHGVIAGVYLDRTATMARELGLDLHVVLGHTMAHEIGHLLLGSNSHAKRGIMRPTWGDREVRLATTGILGFTSAQAERMQAQAAARLGALDRPGGRL